MKMKDIKKALLQERIRLTGYTKERMSKRGYTHSDIISCIWSGEITKIQSFKRVRVIVEGYDMDRLPIVLVVARDVKNPNFLVVVSVFPPILEKFKRVI